MQVDLLRQVLLGISLGFLGALLGGIFDLRISAGRKEQDLGPGGPFLLLVGVGNTLLGATAMVLSLLLTGTLRAALFMGIGFFMGFGAGFLLLATIWIRRSEPANRQPPDTMVADTGERADNG